MSLIKLQGNASGTGTLTIQAPNTNSDYTLTLPAETGTVLTGAGPYAAVSTAPASAAYITAAGRLGVGTSSPSSVLHVAGSNGDGLTISGSGATGVYRPSAAGVEIGSSSGDNLDFLAGAASVKARLTSAGELLTGGTTDNGAYNLQCNGTAVWGAGAYVNGSDSRIKEDVEPIDSGLDVVTKLNPVTYRYKEDWSKDQSIQTGFIAQELLVALEGKNYVDGVVQQGGANGYYSVAYQNIIPILTKAIQELKAITDAQATRIEALEAEVAALKAKA